MAESDIELIEGFFARTRRLNDPARAKALGGSVTVGTLRRWRAELKEGTLRPLSDTSRAALEDYAGGAIQAEGRDMALFILNEVRAKLDELETRLPGAKSIPLDAFNKFR